MKKIFKIFGWTLFSLLVVLVLAVGIACYLIFTPARLTSITHKLADSYITCDYKIGEVELTFFSTFPRLGLRADSLLLIHPMEGAQNDTVVEAGHLTATVDVMAFLKRKQLCIHEFILDDAAVHFYIAPDGTTNLSGVFVSSPDTTQTEDTTAFSLPFDSLRVDGLRVHAKTISFVNAKDTIEASLGETELSAKAEGWNDMLIGLDAQDVCASLKGETYADRLHLEMVAPLAMNLDSMYFAVDGARLAVNAFDLRLEGEVTLSEDIAMDVRLQTGTWDIESLMALVPERFTSSIAEYNLHGDIALDVTAKGTYSDTQMPDITLHQVKANLWHSQIEAKGKVSDIATDMLLDMQVKLNANIPDFKQFIPEGMKVEGRTDGTANVRMRMSDLSEKRLHKGLIDANLTLTDLLYKTDSMVADLPKTTLHVQIPNKKPSRPAVTWARVEMTTASLYTAMDTTMKATLGGTYLRVETGDILHDKQDYFVHLGSESLNGFYEDMKASMTNAWFEAYLVGGKKVSAKLLTDAMHASIGTELGAQTDALAIEAASRYNSEGENFFLQWNPRLKINLTNGRLVMPERLPEIVKIPVIDFVYSNREMNIENARVELGHSDLNLSGNVRNIGKWFRHEAILEGELNVVSDHCDANQLMDWFSADKGSEEEQTETANSQEPTANSQQPTGEADPFLVPTDVNLALNTHMREVEVFNQVAKDMKGGFYINNGTLILDEVGFVCKAAKLQLTAMYRTPRRNHLYVGLDYHMVDVDIDELLSMIPNLEEMVPMLSSFKGAAEFHLAAETYLKSNYEPKMSTLRGAASLTGKDLVVLDGETFDQISKLLLFKKKTENKIDSINAEMTIYKNQIDLYPLCVQMDNYMVALGGRHNTNMTFDYDINVLSPIYLGVNVSGTIDDLQIKLAKCKFAQDFKPHWYQKADTQSREIRERIKQSMEKNVRIK
ncbi:MAG: hypothetical protein IJQ84_04405 [Paludibacteraceae bacterium]|nr:hypothetical protein [Paludibacteraceae bacterium]